MSFSSSILRHIAPYHTAPCCTMAHTTVFHVSLLPFIAECFCAGGRCVCATKTATGKECLLACPRPHSRFFSLFFFSTHFSFPVLLLPLSLSPTLPPFSPSLLLQMSMLLFAHTLCPDFVCMFVIHCSGFLSRKKSRTFCARFCFD